jgi:DNA polymerase III delta subunit
VRALVARAGVNLLRLRTGLERVALYAMGQASITAEDVRQSVPAGPEAQEDFGIANAISRGDPRGALRELGLALDNGAAPFFVLGQIRFAAEKLRAARIAGGVEAVFRTDLALKTSAGDPRVLLERLVVELCDAPARTPSAMNTPRRPR